MNLSSGGIDLRNTAITNSTDYAIYAGPGTTILGLTGMTVTGNGAGLKNAIAYRGGTIPAAETWRPGIPWEIIDGVTVGAGVTLTIEPSAIVRFANNQSLTVLGKLLAVGTPPQPIVFTTNRTTPAAGAWTGLDFKPTAHPESRVAFATIQYAGTYGVGIKVDNSAPQFHHVTISDTTGAAVSVIGSAARPVVRNCRFLRTGSGVSKSADASVDARLSYWDSAGGPSGSGSGSGLSVAAGVLFEPWLLAPPTTTQYFSSASVTNRTFNPSIQTTSTFALATALAGPWTMTITNASAATVRSFSGDGTSGTGVWDGRDGSGVMQPAGTYTFDIASSAAAENATSARGRIIIDNAKLLTVTSFAGTPPLFSPNADGIQDTTLLATTINYDDSQWAVDIKNASGATVRSASGSANVAVAWDGRDGANALQPDGVYAAHLLVSVGTATESRVASVTLDATAPVAAISAPGATQLLSNVFRDGSADVPVVGTVSDANLKNWTVDYGIGASPGAWSVIATGTAPVAEGQLGVWATFALGNSIHTVRLRVWDLGGTLATSVVTPTLGNFKMSQNADQFKPAANQTITYSSTVPFPITETVTVRNAAGQTVRTLFSGTRTAATYTDIWNGRDDANTLVPDGPYYYDATVTDGTSSMRWGLTNQTRSGWGYYYPTFSSDFDPFNNKPLAVTYTFGGPGRIYVIFSPYDMPTPCVAPAYCWKNQMWQESGTHTLYWAGIDDTGALRPDLNKTSVTSFMDNFPKNAVLVYGSKPVLSPVTVTPAFYGPAIGQQIVSFNLTTYQNQPATVQVTFRNQASGSVLRTITRTDQAVGAVSVTWDGLADNGMWVAPGVYIVTAGATDAIGNTVTQQILTNIVY